MEFKQFITLTTNELLREIESENVKVKHISQQIAGDVEKIAKEGKKASDVAILYSIPIVDIEFTAPIARKNIATLLLFVVGSNIAQLSGDIQEDSYWRNERIANEADRILSGEWFNKVTDADLSMVLSQSDTQIIQLTYELKKTMIYDPFKDYSDEYQLWKEAHNE